MGRNNQTTLPSVIIVLTIIGLSLFCMYLAYDAMKQSNQLGAVFYVGLSMSALGILITTAVADSYHGETVTKPVEAQPVNRPVYQPNYRLNSRKGYVYVLAAIHDPTIFKIGRTNNPKDRLRTFSVKLPFDVEYLHTIQTDDMYALESKLHRRFASKRVNGEWFKLSADDLEFLKGMKV